MKITIRNRQKSFPLPRSVRLAVRKGCYGVCRLEAFSPACEVNILFVDDEHIRFLNKTYRGLDKATDVLSFPLGAEEIYDENPETGLLMLGDCVISLETAVRQAFEYGHSLNRECGFLAVHSMLHLLGYDHETSQAEEAIMRAKEKAVLENINLNR
jgi:probable rRNA maturation factor